MIKRGTTSLYSRFFFLEVSWFEESYIVTPNHKLFLVSRDEEWDCPVESPNFES